MPQTSLAPHRPSCLVSILRRVSSDETSSDLSTPFTVQRIWCSKFSLQSYFQCVGYSSWGSGGSGPRFWFVRMKQTGESLVRRQRKRKEPDVQSTGHGIADGRARRHAGRLPCSHRAERSFAMRKLNHNRLHGRRLADRNQAVVNQVGIQQLSVLPAHLLEKRLADARSGAAFDLC